MDKNTLLSEQVESGERLIEALAKDGFDVGVAFWAKPEEEGKWYLYLASSTVDDKGPAPAYRLVHGTLRKMPDLLIDPFEIKVLGLSDSLAQAASALIKPSVPDSPYAVHNPRRFPTRFGGSTLAGISMDGGYIYPAALASAAAQQPAQ
jgi:hypothetical protein